MCNFKETRFGQFEVLSEDSAEYYYRTVLQIYCVIPPHPSNLLGSEPPGANPALKPRETGQAYPRLQVIRTVRVDKSQYYPVRESYSDASGIGELYPPIQITGVC